MTSATFVASALLDLPLALAFLVVGSKLHKRSRLEAQPSLSWFAAFWVGLGAYGLAGALWSLAYLAGHDALVIGLLVLHVKLVGSVVGFAGLVAYLLSIHGRDRRLIAVLIGAYGLILAITQTYYSWRVPIGQEPGRWGMRLLYAVNDTQPWWTIVIGLLLIPPFLASVAYLMLLRHARDRPLRYRIVLTSASLMLFFLPVFVSWRAGGIPWFGAIEQLLSILMVAGIVLAQWPPPRVQAWLAGASSDAQLERERALVERARLLV